MDIAVYGASASNVFQTDTDSNQKPQYAEVAQSVEQQYKKCGISCSTYSKVIRGLRVVGSSPTLCTSDCSGTENAV